MQQSETAIPIDLAAYARRRRALLSARAILAGGCLGILSVLAIAIWRFNAGLDDLYGHLILAFFVLVVSWFAGAIIGLISIPLIVPLLASKNPAVALPFVYGPAALVIVIVSAASDPGTAALAGLGTIACFSVVAALALPRYFSKFPLGCCTACGYDLRHADHQRCPECGLRHEHDRHVVSRHRSACDNILVERRALRWVFSSRWRGAVAVMCAVLVAGWIVVLAFLPHFSESAFRRIQVGMSEAEVRSCIGSPDNVAWDSTGNKELIYEDPLTFPWPTTYVVVFKDDCVIRKRVID